jgi:hypothetical protein
MAWERSFEAKLMAIRNKELSWQKRNYLVEVGFTALWSCTPVVVTLVAFVHYGESVPRRPLAPSFFR